MTTPLSRLVEPAYSAVRIIFGLLFMMQGAAKLFGAFGGRAVPFDLGTTIAWAGVIEFGGGLLILVGLFTWIAAFIASGEMACAYFLVHAPQGMWPMNNGGERAVLFCFAFLLIAARGHGLLSLDGVFFGGQRK